MSTRVSAADGKDCRKFNTHAPITSSPAVAKDHVYVVNGANMLIGLGKDAAYASVGGAVGPDGAQFSDRWRGATFTSALAILPTEEGGLYCLGRPGIEKQKAIWAGALGGPGKSGRIDGSTLPVRGQYAWGTQGGNPKDPSKTSPRPASMRRPRMPGRPVRGRDVVKNRSGLVQIRFAEKELQGKNDDHPGQQRISPAVVCALRRTRSITRRPSWRTRCSSWTASAATPIGPCAASIRPPAARCGNIPWPARPTGSSHWPA